MKKRKTLAEIRQNIMARAVNENSDAVTCIACGAWPTISKGTIRLTDDKLHAAWFAMCSDTLCAVKVRDTSKTRAGILELWNFQNRRGA